MKRGGAEEYVIMRDRHICCFLTRSEFETQDHQARPSSGGEISVVDDPIIVLNVYIGD